MGTPVVNEGGASQRAVRYMIRGDVSVFSWGKKKPFTTEGETVNGTPCGNSLCHFSSTLAAFSLGIIVLPRNSQAY